MTMRHLFYAQVGPLSTQSWPFRFRPEQDVPVGRSQARKRTSVHHDDRVRNVRDRDVISGRAFPAVLERNTSLQIPCGMQQVLLEK